MTLPLGAGLLRGWRILPFPGEEAEATGRSWLFKAVLMSMADDLEGELEVLGAIHDGKTIAEHVALGVLERLDELRRELNGPPGPAELARRAGYLLMRPSIDDAIVDAERTLGPAQIEDAGDELRAEWPTGELMVFWRHGLCDAFWRESTADYLAALGDQAVDASGDQADDLEGLGPVTEGDRVEAASAPPTVELATGSDETTLEWLTHARETESREAQTAGDRERLDAALKVRELAEQRRQELGDTPTPGQVLQSLRKGPGPLAAHRPSLRTIWEELRDEPTSRGSDRACCACGRSVSGYEVKRRPGDETSRQELLVHLECLEQCLRTMGGPYGTAAQMRQELVAAAVHLDGGEVFRELEALVLELRRRRARIDLDWTKAEKRLAKRGRKATCCLCGGAFSVGSSYLDHGSATQLAHESCAATIADEGAGAQAASA